MFGESCFALWGFSWLIILICYFLIFWVCYSQHGFPDAKGPLIGILSRLFTPSLWRFSNFDGTKDRCLRPQLELVEVHACTGRDTSQMLQFVELRHHWFQSLKVNEMCSTQIESKGNHPNRLQDTASSFQWHCFWLFDSTASAPFRSFGTAACIFWVTFPSWSWQEWYFEIFWDLLWWNMMKLISCTVPKIWKSSMSFCTYFAIFGQSRPKKALNQSWHVRFGCLPGCAKTLTRCWVASVVFKCFSNTKCQSVADVRGSRDSTDPVHFVWSRPLNRCWTGVCRNGNPNGMNQWNQQNIYIYNVYIYNIRTISSIDLFIHLTIGYYRYYTIWQYVYRFITSLKSGDVAN